jgi:hypothetical protein
LSELRSAARGAAAGMRKLGFAGAASQQAQRQSQRHG